MYKHFLVVTINQAQNDIEYSKPTDDYNEAFEEFNTAIAVHTEQLFDRPKGENPLRVVLENAVVELWQITRTANLLTK